MHSYHLGTLDGVTPSVHPGAWIAPGVVLVGRVTVGRGASVWYGSVLRADEDEIVVGPECNIQDQCCLHVDEGEPVILAERVSLGHRATVHGAHVEAGALIGIGAIVLGRARVGAGSLVAAGTVVRPGQQIPPGVLVAGVPGRVVRELTDADRATFADTAGAYVRRAARHRDVSWAGGDGSPGGEEVLLPGRRARRGNFIGIVIRSWKNPPDVAREWPCWVMPGRRIAS